MQYSQDDILKFYRILARRLLEIDGVYGIRFHNPALTEVFEKLRKLVNEIDSDQ